ncbi:MAG: DUF3320 domain-containing protein [Sporichthyaceae bacterium]
MSVEVHVEVVPILSYAMAHNRIPVVHRVGLTAGFEVDGAALRIAIRDDEGVVSHPFEQLVDLAPGTPTVLERPDVRLDPAKLLQNRDRRPGWLELELHAGGAVLATARVEVELLPGAMWLAVPPGLSYEMLAAHVLPNDPAVADLLGEASGHLHAATGDPSIDGYQSGPERTDAIVAAIWAAARARGIRYAMPPASWADLAGQKIRTPSEVFDGRVGTCLDTTVALAAALEQADVRPLLWLVEGHAFLGYWRAPIALDAVVSVDATEVMNEIDLGRMALIETTAVTAVEGGTDVAATHRAALAKIADLNVVQAIVDVWTARRQDVLPLPARRTVDGVVQIHEYQAAARQSVVVVNPATGAAGPAAAAAPGRVAQWKNSLLDLSLRNRLLNYTDRTGIGLRVPEGRLGLLEDLVSAGQPIALRPSDQLDAVDAARGVRTAWELDEDRARGHLEDKRAVFTDVAAAGYLTRMRNLAHKARTVEEESGANNLYLALGSLVWTLEGRQLRSPLILVPVRLSTTARGQLYRLALDESGGATPNFCLLEKLRTAIPLTIPKLAEPDADSSGIDLDGTLQAVREAIAEKGLAFRVEPTADLAILAFAKFRLWKDLDEHWPALLANPLVRHLVETPTLPFADPAAEPANVDLDELDAACPIPADASQLAAIAEAVAGRTFVLEGPPGTGKSQTITNLLVRAVAEGRRVLFVAEKRAALDVVASRLASVGMGPFALDLHDKGAKPALVRAQIRRAMDHAVEVDAQGLAAAAEDLRSSRRTLDRYATRLHEPNAAGLSYYTARTKLLSLGADGPSLPIPVTALRPGVDWDSVRRTLRNLPDVADVTRPGPDHPWAFLDRVLDAASAAELAAAAAAFDRALSALPSSGPLATAVEAARSVDDLVSLGALAAAPVPLALLETVVGEQWRTAAAGLRADLTAFPATAHPGLDRATAAALDLDLTALRAEAQAAEDSGFFGRGKRRRAVLAHLAPVLRVEVEAKDALDLLADLLRTREAIAALHARVGELPGIAATAGWSPLRAEDVAAVVGQLDWLQWAAAAVCPAAPSTFADALRAWLAGEPAADPAAAAAARDAAEIARRFLAAAGSPAALAAWRGEDGLVRRWRATATRRNLADPEGQDARRWSEFREALEPLRAAGLEEAVSVLTWGQIAAEEAAAALERGLAAASAAERRTGTGLDAFVASTHDRTVARFAAAAGTVREHLTAAVPEQVLTRRAFRADSAVGLVGELRREVGRQRGGLGVRSLMAKYGDLITSLLPCVLVSPDSVSRFFPVGAQSFDLVVFDEASQIRVADAVGAMGRAGSVVVVGDSKQMPPTSVAESVDGLEEDDLAGEVLPDEESLLTEAVFARVPQRWLTWHYRSQDEALIAFSNGHYYDGKLSSFPAPVRARTASPADGYGLSLVRVDGHFQRAGKGRDLRTNAVEAHAIVAEIRRRFDASPDALPSLGVVTFNAQQRALVEELLRDAGEDRLIEALDGRNGEGLFVKNLENVQGDERDAILFSTAFSANERGVLPLNFGPLTRAGGERRLNVAITRARRQVLVYSSFDPQDLRVEQTQATGIHHLRAYLEFAARGVDALGGTARPRPLADRHRDEIAERLRGHGLTVRTDVGLSEFRVDLTLAPADDPDVPVVAVLLDGPGWAARRTVGDRDGLPIHVLGRLMRWPRVERVWLPQWLANPDVVLAALLDAVEAGSGAVLRGEVAAPDVHDTTSILDALPEDAYPLADVPGGQATLPQGPDSDSASLASSPVGDPTSQPSGPAAEPAVRASGPAAEPGPLADVVAGSRAAGSRPAPALDGQREFLGWAVRPAGDRAVLDALPSPAATARVAAVAVEVVAAEGPVHTERLARLVAASFDLTRLSQARIDAILRAVPAACVRDGEEPFVWAPGAEPADWTEFRVAADASVREFEHVALRELGNAMVALCRFSAGMSAAELATETLALFGGRRKTSGIAARLEAARDLATARGRLKLTADGRYVAA